MSGCRDRLRYVFNQKELFMRFQFLAGSLLAALALQGCAGTPAVLGSTQQKSLQSLQLFGPDARARFNLYLTCNDKHGSCAAAENAFSNWSRSRNIRLQLIDPGDSSPAAGGEGGRVPYRMTIELAPMIIPSYDESGGVHGNMRGGYSPPRIGYTARIEVFNAANGKLLLAVNAQDQKTGKYKGDTNEYIRAEMSALIGSLDPSYKTY